MKGLKMLPAPTRRRATAIASVACVVAVLAGCGSSGSSSSQSSSSSPQKSSSGAAALMAKVNQDLAIAEKPLAVRPPTSGPKAVPNKTVVVVPCSMAAVGCSLPANAALDAIKAIGWHGLLIDGQGDPTKQAAAFRQAVANHAAGIIAIAIPPTAVESPLKAARAAGLKTVLLGAANTGNGYDAVSYSDKAAPQQGYQIAEYAYKATGGHLRMAIFDDNEFSEGPSEEGGTRAFLSYCEMHGGDCQISGKQDFLVSTLSTTLSQLAGAFVQAHPTTNVVWSSYDAAATSIQQGLQQAGLINKSIGVSFNCNPSNVAVVKAGGWEKACAGAPLGWAGYTSVDEMNRLFSGQTHVAEEPIPLEIINQANAPSGQYNGNYDYATAFKKLWTTGK